MRKLPLTVLAKTLIVASFTGIFAGTALADTNADITVTATVPANVSSVDYRDSQNQTLKQALSTNFDLSLVQSQRQRDGLASINLRGLQGNRVALTLDGLSLGEGLESRFYSNKLKALSFGRGNYLEPTSLVSVLIDTNANGNSLSGSVNFKTINPEDILKGKANAGYLFTNYNSVDSSFTASKAYAFRAAGYQGMLLGTYRNSHEQINAAGKQSNSVVGEARLAANPLNAKTGYFLTKHFYQLNENNKLGLTLEFLRNNGKTNELSTVSTVFKRGNTATTFKSANNNDSSSRVRFDLSNEYESDGLVWNAKFSYQNSESVSRRIEGYSRVTTTTSGGRGSAGTSTGSRSSSGNSSSNGSTATTATTTTTEGTIWKGGDYSYKTFAFNNEVKKNLDLAGVQHQLAFNANFNYAISDFDINNVDSNTGYTHLKIMPKSKEFTTLFRLSDRFVLADYNLVVKPQLSLLYSGISASKDGGYVQLGGNWTNMSKKSNFRVLPGLYLEKVVNRNFRPYFNYSHGARIPSVQHYYAAYDRGMLRDTKAYLVGNPRLKVETSHNFELGVTGSNENFAYKVAGFINKYHNFISRKIYRGVETIGTTKYTYFTYENLNKQTLMGALANLKFNIGNGWKATAAVQYTTGTTVDVDGVKSPANSVDPLRWSVGFNYDASNWGAALAGTYIGAKTDDELKLRAGTFNPTSTAFIVDASVYYKPTDYLTINAGINNLFNKAYINWSSISYYYTNFFEEGGGVAGVTEKNWLGYTEPGRNYFISAKFNF